MGEKTREFEIITKKLKVLTDALIEELVISNDLEIGGGITNVETVQFDTSFSDGTAEGRLQWDNDAQTLAVGMPGGNVNLQIGQENLIRVKNTSGGNLPNGTVIRIDGATGNNPLVDVADNSSIATVNALGWTTEDIDDNQFGYVATTGLVRGDDSQPINTSGMTAGDLLWLDTSGGFTNVRPTSPTWQVIVGTVLRAHASLGVVYGIIIVVPQMQGLSDVSAVPANAGEFLAWNDSANRFEIAQNITIDPTTGNLQLSGDGTVWDDLRFPLTAIRVGAVGAPDFAQILDDGAGSTGVFAYHFDKTVEEQLHFVVQLPHAWKEGSTIYPHLHWMASDTDTGTVVWGLEYSWSNISSVAGNTTIITGQEAATGVALYHELTPIGSGISGVGSTASSILVCRLFRDVTNAADNYNADAIGLEIDFHYEIDKMGDFAQPGLS